MQLFKSLAMVATVIGLVAANPTYDPAPLKHEHAGQMFSPSGVPKGINTTIAGINSYIAYPPGKKGKSKNLPGILFLSDIFGNALINNLFLLIDANGLADNLARAGYVVVLPDLFDGDPIPIDRPATFNMTAWRLKHPEARIDAITESTIKELRGSKYGIKKLASVGYCFGGKYVARFLAPGKGLDAGFTAHPSGVIASEWTAISYPISIAFGELDGSSTPAQRAAAEAIFQSTNVTFQTTLYSNAEHGFAVRTNLTIPEKKFAQESAYFQAVRFFNAYL